MSGGDPREAITNLALFARGLTLKVTQKDYLDPAPLPDRLIEFPNQWLSILD